jgi:dTMP kinase
MFIVIEGLDGVGKSTITKALGAAIDATILTTPGGKFSDIRDQLENIYSDNNQARQLFYMSTVVSVSERARQLAGKGEHVIVDRYWLSTQVYHHWKSNNSHFELPDVAASLLVPDLTLYLELPLEQRKQRLGGRAQNTAEDNLTLTDKADAELNNLYQHYSQSDITGRWLKVDAALAVNEIIGLVCKELKIIQEESIEPRKIFAQ